MMNHVVVFGLWLSGISFALFVVSLLVNLFRQKTVVPTGGAGDVEQQGAPADVAKLFEAFSKLADSLNHSSPVVLSLMASIIFFVLSLLGAGLGAGVGGGTRPQNGTSTDEGKKSDVSLATQVCVFSPFDVGKHELSEAIHSELNRDSEECGTRWLTRISSSSTAFLLLVGHSDRRSLRGRQSYAYGTNETLAYQRALALKKALLAKYVPAATRPLSSEEFALRMIIVEGGPAYLDRAANEPQLAEDRSVEVISMGLTPADAASHAARP